MNKSIAKNKCTDLDELFRRAADKCIKVLQKSFEKAFPEVKGYVNRPKLSVEEHEKLLSYWKLLCVPFNDQEFVKRITNCNIEKYEERKKKQKELDKKWEELDEEWKKGVVYTEIKVDKEKLKQGIFEYDEVPVSYEEVFSK